MQDVVEPPIPLWLARAIDYNVRNGVPDKDVPPAVLRCASRIHQRANASSGVCDLAGAGGMGPLHQTRHTGPRKSACENVAAPDEGVFKTMFSTNLKIASAFLLATAGVALAGATARQTSPPNKQGQTPMPNAKADAIKEDPR